MEGQDIFHRRFQVGSRKTPTAEKERFPVEGEPEDAIGKGSGEIVDVDSRKDHQAAGFGHPGDYQLTAPSPAILEFLAGYVV